MKSSFNSFLAINKYQKHENAVFNSGWVADRSMKRRAIFFECDHWFRFVWFKKPKFLYKSMIWKIVKYTCLVFENRSCFFQLFKPVFFMYASFGVYIRHFTMHVTLFLFWVSFFFSCTSTSKAMRRLWLMSFQLVDGFLLLEWRWIGVVRHRWCSVWLTAMN